MGWGPWWSWGAVLAASSAGTVGLQLQYNVPQYGVTSWSQPNVYLAGGIAKAGDREKVQPVRKRTVKQAGALELLRKRKRESYEGRKNMEKSVLVFEVYTSSYQESNLVLACAGSPRRPWCTPSSYSTLHTRVGGFYTDCCRRASLLKSKRARQNYRRGRRICGRPGHRHPTTARRVSLRPAAGRRGAVWKRGKKGTMKERNVKGAHVKGRTALGLSSSRRLRDPQEWYPKQTGLMPTAPWTRQPRLLEFPRPHRSGRVPEGRPPRGCRCLGSGEVYCLGGAILHFHWPFGTLVPLTTAG